MTHVALVQGSSAVHALRLAQGGTAAGKADPAQWVHLGAQGHVTVRFPGALNVVQACSENQRHKLRKRVREID